MDDWVRSGAREGAIDGIPLDFNLPYPQEQLWVMYSLENVQYLGVRGEATGDTGTSSAMVPAGFIAIIHTHPRWAKYIPGPDDYGKKVPVYGISKDGAWVIRPGSRSPTGIYGVRPRK